MLLLYVALCVKYGFITTRTGIACNKINMY